MNSKPSCTELSIHIHANVYHYFWCTHPLSFLVTQEIKKIADHENNILDLLPFLDIVLKLNIYISKYHRIVADNKYFSTVMHTSEVLLILLCIYTPKDFLTIKVCIG